jgi:hypothetical protein
MIDILRKLFFSRDEVEADGLDQAQREAIIDLLLLATFSDDYVDLSERTIVDKTVERFNWDSPISVDDYIQSSTARAKEAGSSKQSRECFLVDISQRLGTKEHKYRALRLCNLLLYADADLQLTEVQFIRKIVSIFDLK